jgi:hypothetical protein
MSKEEFREICRLKLCPKCGAPAGSRCVGPKGVERKAVHSERTPNHAIHAKSLADRKMVTKELAARGLATYRYASKKKLSALLKMLEAAKWNEAALPVPIESIPTARPVVVNPRRRAWPEGFYNSEEWRRVRYLALRSHGGACQCCGATPSRGFPLHVDHVKPRSKYPELELDIDNLQVLCADCNLGKGAWDETDWRAARA